MESGTGDGRNAGRGKLPWQWPVLALLALGASYLLLAHGDHMAAWLPVLLLLACPLMHLFHGHGGHAHHGHHRSEERPDRSARPTDERPGG